nr:hypothetical protein CFP56_56524 [Quercus suber]
MRINRNMPSKIKRDGTQEMRRDDVKQLADVRCGTRRGTLLQGRQIVLRRVGKFDDGFRGRIEESTSGAYESSVPEDKGKVSYLRYVRRAEGYITWHTRITSRHFETVKLISCGAPGLQDHNESRYQTVSLLHESPVVQYATWSGSIRIHVIVTFPTKLCR